MPPFGQSIKDNFLVIRDNPVGLTPLTFESVSNGECCIALPALAETVFTNSLYNDHFSPLFFWNKGFSTATLWLQKNVNGSWVDKVQLNANTWSDSSLAYDPKVFGFFENQYGEKAIGYTLAWSLVLNDVTLGEGNYRVKSIGTLLIGAGTVTKYSLEFCLQAYTAARADETVRLDWWLNGTIGHPDDDRLKRDYGNLNWFNQLRLPESRFGYNESDGTTEFVKYQTGAMTWLQDDSTKRFKLITGRYDEALHNYIEIDILQAGWFRITDFNIFNPCRSQDRYIVRDGLDYKPGWDQGSLKASVEVKFQQGYQNQNHKRN